ncbi:thioredoxin family protein [Phenylobacterium sp. J426]|uniref:protein-disulfide reductase DsbD family protein n=1 Tax=Phenylobacterium sp. J426 TaxID=2898439 RepID=UPI002150AC4E|nr:protein-disulfide reductase DsbD domain-containing protein [Phenylobacterium sp. J426]MCR5873512.1 thioredoxin family protein [Phenylobacterium sp. J426]
MRFLAGLLSALVATMAIAGAAKAAPVNTGHLIAELAPEARGVAPGQTIHVALVQKIQDGWHTYWRNPGDSGEPTSIAWELPAGWTAGEFVWPAPHRLPVGPLVNYGYEGQVVLPVPLTAPATARPGETLTLKAKATFLVCAEICIPESADLTLDLPVVAAPAPADPRWGPTIRQALAETPKPAGLSAAFSGDASGLKLAVTGAAVAGADLADAYFFPFSGTAIDHAKPQPIERGPEGLTLTLPPGVDFQAGEGPAEIAGVLTFGDKAYELTAARGPAPAGAAGLGPPPARSASGGVGGVGMGLLGAAVFALLGGLILNLMPCVFPVLAMKAASLAKHGGSGEARREGLAFGAGVVVTFLALAGLLIALKAAGSEIGWGFQLQSPPVVAFLALLMLAVALNLSGVFEVAGSLQNVGSGLAGRGGIAGAFFTGALAVVVAAPCTAPFMGPALGWALTQPAVSALVVFLALAAGFALPFVAVAFAPRLLARLPKPGPWMDAFRKALAFPMYAAAAWLAWVLTQQAGADGLARLFAAAVVLAVAAWLAGIAQRRAVIGRRPLPQGLAAAVLAVLAVAAVVGPRYTEAQAASAEPGVQGASAEHELYSPERLAALRAEGRPVFVNYTAAWCVSCQVNERVALSTRGVAEAMARNNVAYLKADWTKKDASIAAELARFGRAGVPLYLLYGAGQAEPRILPALLTEGAVVKALDAAAKPS